MLFLYQTTVCCLRIAGEDSVGRRSGKNVPPGGFGLFRIPSGRAVARSGRVVAGSGLAVAGSGCAVARSGLAVAGSGRVVAGSGRVVARSGGVVAGSGRVATRSGGVVAGSGGRIFRRRWERRRRLWVKFSTGAFVCPFPEGRRVRLLREAQRAGKCGLERLDV